MSCGLRFRMNCLYTIRLAVYSIAGRSLGSLAVSEGDAIECGAKHPCWQIGAGMFSDIEGNIKEFLHPLNTSSSLLQVANLVTDLLKGPGEGANIIDEQVDRADCRQTLAEEIDTQPQAKGIACDIQ